MYNKFTIIITAENKENYISETIESCLNLTNFKNYKIYVVYTFLANEMPLKQKFNKYRNILFIKNLIKKKYPTQDQLSKIEIISNFINNEWILLLDGDDKFVKKKLVEISKKNLNKDILYLNNHVKVINKKIYNSKVKNYKELKLFRILFNDWPQNINTSSILISGNLLKKFYKNTNPYLWRYLAIDVQLVLYYYYKKKFKFIDKVLTLKIENINNLDKKFSNFTKKIFWERRLEQHNLTNMLSGKNNFLDKCLSHCFKYLLNLFQQSQIRKNVSHYSYRN